MAPRTVAAALNADQKASSDHGLVYSETTGLVHSLLGNGTAEFLEKGIKAATETAVAGIQKTKLGKYINLVESAKFGVATTVGITSGTGLKKTVDKVEIDWVDETVMAAGTGLFGDIVAGAWMAGLGVTSGVWIPSAAIAATAAVVIDGARNAKDMDQRIASKISQLESAKQNGKAIPAAFQTRLDAAMRRGKQIAEEMHSNEQVHQQGGVNNSTDQTQSDGGHPQGTGGHQQDSQHGGYGYGYNTQLDNSNGDSTSGNDDSDPNSGTPPSDTTPSDPPNTDSGTDDGTASEPVKGIVIHPTDDEITTTQNNNPEDPASDGKTSPPSVGPAPGDVGGRYSHLMNPGSERGGRPSPDDNGGGPFDDRSSSGGRGGRGSSGPGSDRSNADDDYGCDPLTGGGLGGGGTQDEVGWNFYRRPPKKGGGGQYGDSGTGFDDLYRPNPEDDYGVGGPTARIWNNAESVDALVAGESAETSTEMSAEPVFASFGASFDSFTPANDVFGAGFELASDLQSAKSFASAKADFTKELALV